MNTEDDHDIKSFFDDMRKKDAQQSIADFEELLPKRNPSKIKYLIPISIAASVMIGFGVWYKKPKTITEENTIVITIENQKTTTSTLLSEEISAFTWQSSSASLINDFND